jgi:hypothetical protein
MMVNFNNILLPPIRNLSPKKKSLKKKIKNLPYELKIYIFDFLKLDLWLNEFIDTLNSQNCSTLDYSYLRPLIPRSLAIPAFTFLCIQNIKHFKNTWDLFKKKKGKNFKLLKNGDDFALSLLMNYYH